MANMGFSRLILIDPKCEFTLESQKAAATGQFALQNKIIYPNWNEFYSSEPDGIRIALTARDGRSRQVEDLQFTLSQILETHPSFKKHSVDPIHFYLIFGPEDWGLSADDIQYVHHCCSIPTFGDNASLNLAQATLLAQYIFRSVFGGERTKLDGQQTSRAKQRPPKEIFPDETLRIWLETMNMDLSKKKMNVFTVLRRMLLQNAPTSKEFRMLEIVLQQSIRKMKSSKKIKIDKLD
jgi:tRNA/rRNA methyltransferase